MPQITGTAATIKGFIDFINSGGLDWNQYRYEPIN
jgi:hypothetical protein